MLKIVLFLLGLIGGAGGMIVWLLSAPAPNASAGPYAPDGDRFQRLKSRFRAARAEGTAAGQQAESRMRRELDVLRRYPSGRAASS